MTVPFDALSDVSDEALLVAFGHGDRGAAMALTRRLTPLALRTATRLLHGNAAEAEDVAQDAMMRLWKIAPEWRQGEAKVSTWLYRVVANLCTDRLRRSGRTVAMEGAPEPADETPGAEQGLIAADRVAALDAALGALPERQRQAVVLRHLEGLGNPEIAAIMDMSVEAVESLTARGKRGLAQRLAPRRKELGYDED